MFYWIFSPTDIILKSKNYLIFIRCVLILLPDERENRFLQRNIFRYRRQSVLAFGTSKTSALISVGKAETDRACSVGIVRVQGNCPFLELLIRPGESVFNSVVYMHIDAYYGSWFHI